MKVDGIACAAECLVFQLILLLRKGIESCQVEIEQDLWEWDQ